MGEGNLADKVKGRKRIKASGREEERKRKGEKTKLGYKKKARIRTRW